MADNLSFQVDPNRVISLLKTEKETLGHQNVMLQAAFEQMQDEYNALRAKYEELQEESNRPKEAGS